MRWVRGSPYRGADHLSIPSLPRAREARTVTGSGMCVHAW